MRRRGAKSLTFWGALEAYPPLLVRLLARQGRGGKSRALSDAELAIASGIPRRRVEEIILAGTWDDVTLGEARRLFAACGFDPTCARDRDKQLHYVKTCKTVPHYLRTSPDWETRFLPLMKKLTSLTTCSKASALSPSPGENS